MLNKVRAVGYFDHGAHQYKPVQHAWSLWGVRINNGAFGLFPGVFAAFIIVPISIMISNSRYDHEIKERCRKKRKRMRGM